MCDGLAKAESRQKQEFYTAVEDPGKSQTPRILLPLASSEKADDHDGMTTAEACFARR
jgi:hypothetical protein